MSTAIDTSSSSSILTNYIANQNASSGTSATKTSSNSSDTSLSSVTGDFNTFLKILITQLQNQDPTNATDPNQFTQELVQFSAVEQQINTNGKLDDILQAINSNGLTPLLSYVGKYIETSTSDKLVVQGGSAQFAYTLPSEATSVSVTITNEDGDEVARLVGATESGLNRVTWDALDGEGNTVSDGTYKMKITAKDSNGKALDVSDIRLIGRVTSVQTDDDGTATLHVGDVSVADTDVDAVFNAST